LTGILKKQNDLIPKSIWLYNSEDKDSHHPFIKREIKRPRTCGAPKTRLSLEPIRHKNSKEKSHVTVFRVIGR
jgi:hypothetical protein